MAKTGTVKTWEKRKLMMKLEALSETKDMLFKIYIQYLGDLLWCQVPTYYTGLHCTLQCQSLASKGFNSSNQTANTQII